MLSLPFSNVLIAALFFIVLCIAPAQANDLTGDEEEWAAAAVELLYANAHYPGDAAKAGIEGRTVVDILVSADGRIISASISESSGPSILDEAALKAVNETGALPPLKLKAGMEQCIVHVPFNYALRGGTQDDTVTRRDLHGRGTSVPLRSR
ncbi:MAG: hypothetical protein C0454_12475 [Parvibaculum sp.]|nr:hypothetical protein [Parvibaculum sp.]